MEKLAHVGSVCSLIIFKLQIYTKLLLWKMHHLVYIKLFSKLIIFFKLYSENLKIGNMGEEVKIY